jgi:nitrite reductase/ring-hydroxylating ferredoxin subunit
VSVAGERGASRRDLFRILGRVVADAAGRRLPGAGATPPPPSAPPQEPEAEAPLERARLVVDLALHPVPAQRARRFVNPAWPGPVLLVRVTMDHFAAVDGDCPHCGLALTWEPSREVVHCPRDGTSFRMDGLPAEGRRDASLRSYPCYLAGLRLEIGLPGDG